MRAKMRKTFLYELPQVGENEFPHIADKLPRGAEIAVTTGEDGSVQILGNSKGLSYFAKYLVAMGLIRNKNGLHVHLDSETEMLSAGSLSVTVRNSDFERCG